jgi:hypothetical protein
MASRYRALVTRERVIKESCVVYTTSNEPYAEKDAKSEASGNDTAWIEESHVSSALTIKHIEAIT